jgi:hypothetical protein
MARWPRWLLAENMLPSRCAIEWQLVFDRFDVVFHRIRIELAVVQRDTRENQIFVLEVQLRRRDYRKLNLPERIVLGILTRLRDISWPDGRNLERTTLTASGQLLKKLFCQKY